MLRQNIIDLMSFIVVARVGSFTRAAAQIGVSQSALSHAMKGLEERLGVRLLTRTTRRVSPTIEGERIVERIGPLLAEVEEELAAILDTKDRPAGTIRITATDYAADTVLWPKLKPILRDYPDLKVEIATEYGLTDIVAEKFDAGVRLGEQVAEGMIAVRIGPDFRMVVIGSPAYFASRGTPRTPQDLMRHDCINLRLPTHGGLYAWEFEKAERELRVRVEGQLIFNAIGPIVEAARAGYGLGYVPEGLVRHDIDEGRLVAVLEDWSPPFPGYFLYYPHRRQDSPAFAVLVEALRHTG